MPTNQTKNQIPTPTNRPQTPPSSSAQNQVVKVKKKPIFVPIITSIIAILLIGLLIFSVWNPFKKAEVKVAERLNLTSFNSSYKVGTDFTVTNEQTFDYRQNNKYYTVKTDYSVDTIRSAALKLGLSNEAFNQTTKYRAWTKPGVNDLNSDYIMINEFTRYLDVQISTGINYSSTVDENSAYSYVADFFGLAKNNVERFSNMKTDNVLSLTYRYKLNDQTVYFDSVSESYSIIRVVNGKITEFFAFLVPLELEEKGELKRLEKINSANLPSASYQIAFDPESVYSSSEYGSETYFNPPAEIGFRKATPAYKYWKDSKQGILFLPSYLATGIYTDKDSQRGNFKMIVVNQGL